MRFVLLQVIIGEFSVLFLNFLSSNFKFENVVCFPGTSVYGIRRYSSGAWLASHLDKMETHVISAILNIGQKGAIGGTNTNFAFGS